MSMTYGIRQAGAVTIIDLGGRIGLTDVLATGPGNRVELHKLIRDVVSAGSKNILVNLRDVIHIDSSGIGELFASYTTVRNQGGTLKLTMPIERVKNVFNLTKLNTVVEVIQDEGAAIRSFDKGESRVSAA